MKQLRGVIFFGLAVLLFCSSGSGTSSAWDGIWVEENSKGEPVALLYFNPDGSFYASGLNCKYSVEEEGRAFALDCNGFKEKCSIVRRTGHRVIAECRSYAGPELKSSGRVILRRIEEAEARKIRSELEL